MAIKLDFTLETPEERKKLVEEILADNPNPSPQYLEILTDYLVLCMEKQDKKEKKLLTDNRMSTVNKRETSFEGLSSTLENGEDGIYNLIANDKNIIFSPKISISQEDVDTIPALKELREEIAKIEQKCLVATGRDAYLLKKQLIQMRQDQYIIKNAYQKPIFFLKTLRNLNKLDLTERVYIDESGAIQVDSLGSLMDENFVSSVICNYSKLKQETYDDLNSDARWMLLDLEKAIDDALLEDYEIYYDIIVNKVEGKSNIEIQELLDSKHNIKHSVEYISSLYRNKIPKIIAENEKEKYLIWYYTNIEKGKWKKCGRCGEIKLAHNHFFSINKTSKDSFYSICKECRNNKKK